MTSCVCSLTQYIWDIKPVSFQSSLAWSFYNFASCPKSWKILNKLKKGSLKTASKPALSALVLIRRKMDRFDFKILTPYLHFFFNLTSFLWGQYSVQKVLQTLFKVRFCVNLFWIGAFFLFLALVIALEALLDLECHINSITYHYILLCKMTLQASQYTEMPSPSPPELLKEFWHFRLKAL